MISSTQYRLIGTVAVVLMVVTSLFAGSAIGVAGTTLQTNDEPAATNAEAITLEDASGAPGETVSMTLSTNATDVAGYQANLSFDPDVVQVTEVTGEDFSDPTTNIDNEAGTVFITQSGVTGIDQPNLVTIEFEIVADTAAESTVEIVEGDTSLSNGSGETIEIGSYTDGTVTVVDEDPVFDGEVSVESANDVAGETVSVNVTAEAPDVVGYEAVIEYDPDVATFVSAGDGDLGTPSVNADAGTVTLTVDTADPVDDPTLSTLEFELVGDSGTETDLTFDTNATTLDHAETEIDIKAYNAGTLSVVDPDEQTTIAVEDTTATPGSTATVNVSTNSDNVAGYQANLTFDPDVVQVTGVSGVDFSDPTSNVQNSDGYVFFTQSQATGVDRPTLAQIELEIVGDPGNETELAFVSADTQVNDANGNTVDIERFDAGTVSVPNDKVVLADYTVDTNVEDEVAQGETINTTITVANTADSTQETTVAYTFDGEVVEESVSVAADAEKTISIEYDVDVDQPTGTVEQSVAVGGEVQTGSSLEVFELGDVDHSGNAGSADVTKIQRSIIGIEVDGTFNPAAGDVDQNGAVTSADVTALQRQIIGLAVIR